ncbi:MAG: RNA-binding S4 domain-containing protein [Bacilli bacterium]|nr:RNA-binding S4 domain-containing protein [Bacillales bacterium]MDY2574903.1 RNA-binding S4 domain-containing protein [Bacilli bacterium]
MRLDKYLKISRVIKRRTIAKDIIDIGLVKINDKVAKPSSEVKELDEIELTLGDRILRIKVLSLLTNPRKENASQMYEIIDENVIKNPL